MRRICLLRSNTLPPWKAGLCKQARWPIVSALIHSIRGLIGSTSRCSPNRWQSLACFCVAHKSPVIWNCFVLCLPCRVRRRWTNLDTDSVDAYWLSQLCNRTWIQNISSNDFHLKYTFSSSSFVLLFTFPIMPSSSLRATLHWSYLLFKLIYSKK